MAIQYTTYTFTERELARTWLRDNAFSPVPHSIGLWAQDDGTQVEAFKNSAGTWTVTRYTEPNPAHYICE